MAQWKCSQGHNWKAPVCNRARHKRASGCPACRFSKNRSASEVEILNYVKQLLPGDDVISSDRELVSPYEVDIYIPSKNFAIEFNGVYWHSENAGKDRLYHLKKQQMCRKKNVELFTVWEDDYRENAELIHSMLAHKLGASAQRGIYARDTIFSVLTAAEGVTFMDANHLQKSHSASRYYGLRTLSDGKIVAVMGIKRSKKRHQIEIARFAASAPVPGGFSKLLTNILRLERYSSVEKIVSYSHNDHSWGEVYQKNGFTRVHDGTPGYFYVVNGRREHRLNYSPKRFKERDDLLFEEGMSERELAAFNGLNRIWDCGSARWEKTLD